MAWIWLALVGLSSAYPTVSADEFPSVSAGIPQEIRDRIDGSPNPAGWYRAFDILVPALMDYMHAVDAAGVRYNTALGDAGDRYRDGMDQLNLDNQTAIMNACDAYWGTAWDAEDALRVAHDAAMATYNSIVGPARTDYDQEVVELDMQFPLDEEDLGAEAAWTIWLMSELAAWNSFAGIQNGAAEEFISALDDATGTWTETMNAAWLAAMDALEAADIGARAENNRLDDQLASDIEDAEWNYLADMFAAESNWEAAVDAAEAAFNGNPVEAPYEGFGTTGNAMTFAAEQDGGAGGGGVAGFFGSIWDFVEGLPQATFDQLETTDWIVWRFAMDVFLDGRPIAEHFLEHSLQNNPPDLVFQEGHFIPVAIARSAAFQSAIAEIANSAAATYGPGQVIGNRTIAYSGGTDLHVGVGQCELHYTLLINPDHTWSMTAYVTDTYDFDLSTGYFSSGNISGVGLTIANNAAYYDQHDGTIETYDWRANLPEQTGTW